MVVIKWDRGNPGDQNSYGCGSKSPRRDCIKPHLSLTENRSGVAIMKAIRVHTFGGPETLVYEDVIEPAPGVGEVVQAHLPSTEIQATPGAAEE